MGSTAKLHAVPTLAQLAQLFPKRTVLVVGDLVADHYIYGQTDRVSREAPVLIVRYESSEVKLGGAANAAANARSLGGQVIALGVLGFRSIMQLHYRHQSNRWGGGCDRTSTFRRDLDEIARMIGL